MKKLNAFYFSGTGNTRYVTKRLCEKLGRNFETEVFDITEKADFSEEIKKADMILLAFPIYGSSPPVPMRRFVYANENNIKNKDIVIIITQYMFSGDGAASLGRTVEKLGGNVLFAEHFNMPNNLADCKMFKIRNGDENKKILDKAEMKIEKFAARIISGKPFRRGYGVLSHATGYYCQRKFWRKNESEKKSKLKINKDLCVGCGLCQKNCPVHNIKISGKTAVPQGNCALCYRCVNICPKQAITLCGKSAPEKQYKGL